MNLKEIIEMALLNLNEDLDDITKAELSETIKTYVNVAYIDIMKNIVKPFYQESVSVKNHVIEFSDFRFVPKNIIAVNYHTSSLDFEISEQTVYVAKLKDGEVAVKYNTEMHKLINDWDMPEFDEGFHSVLSDYATYRMLLSGSRPRQMRAEPFYREYINGYSRITNKNVTKIINKY